MSISSTDYTPKEITSFEMFNAYFPFCHRLHLITIKPPRGQCRIKWVANDFARYLRKKGDIKQFWLVPSISETEYDHFHGIIQLHDSNKYVTIDSEKVENALRVKVHRGKNFFDMRVINGNLKRVYDYIKAQKSTHYEHGSMLAITEVACSVMRKNSEKCCACAEKEQ